jgi:NAD(P)-dependent dehydrogenase (short-subunit alcohol dehydrogenase family)
MEDTRVVAITGAAGAIAGTVARRFETEGWRLALLDLPRNQAGLRERFPDALAVGADLTEEDDAASAIHAATEHYGRVDALLNVAGGFAMATVTEVTLADLERQLSLNLRTAFNATRAVLPGMLERGEGAVVGVGAGPGLDGGARMSAYGAAKAAVAGFFRSVRAEVEPFGVGVSLLFPMGTVDTPANRRAMPDADPGRWIDPDEIASAMLYLVSRSRRGRVRELLIHAG